MAKFSRVLLREPMENGGKLLLLVGGSVSGPFKVVPKPGMLRVMLSSPTTYVFITLYLVPYNWVRRYCCLQFTAWKAKVKVNQSRYRPGCV